MTTTTINSRDQTLPGEARRATDLEQARAANRLLLEQNKALQDELDKLNTSRMQEVQESEDWTKTWEALNADHNRLIDETKMYDRELDDKMQQKQLLDERLAGVAARLRELDELRARTDSLYKDLPILPHSHTITLVLAGMTLTASSHPGMKFPVALIMALKPANIPGNEIIKNACRFLLLSKEDWRPRQGNTWSYDLQPVLRGKLPPGTYQVLFSHFHPDEFDGKIFFQSRKITFSDAARNNNC